MTESKEKTDAEKHEAFEKKQAKDGIAVHSPRFEPGFVNGAPVVTAPDDGKKKK